MNCPGIELGDIVTLRKGNVDPTGEPDALHELYSIPGFDAGQPEILPGKRIRSAKTRVFPGDILFSKLNPRISRIWRVRESTGRSQICSTEFLPLVPDETRLAHDYLLHFLRSDGFRTRLLGQVEAATRSRSRLKPWQVLREPIRVPPLDEQHRIADLLDEVDHLRRLRAEADTEAARILPALFIKMFGDPATWPDSGDAVPLGDLIELRGGMTPSKSVAEYWNGAIPWVTPKDMKTDHIVGSIDHVSGMALESTNLRVIRPPAVLIVVRGMILAHSVPVAMAAAEVTINQDMKALMPRHPRINGEHLFASLIVSRLRLLERVGQSAHGTRKLDTDALLSLPVPLPSAVQLGVITRAVQGLRAQAEKRANSARLIDGIAAALAARCF